MAKEWMGHSNISVTAKNYAHMMDEVFEQSRKQLVEYANSKKHNEQVRKKWAIEKDPS